MAAGMEVNKQNQAGNTVLHLASHHEIQLQNQLDIKHYSTYVINRLSLVKKLTAYGASFTLKNKQGLTASNIKKQIQSLTKTVLLNEVGYFAGSQSNTENLIPAPDTDIQFVSEIFNLKI